ncbi:MAG: thiopurine S-methyltransferase [Gammaproteobacteria bacterium]|nr:thiopurine S-methyltransferase [Gammaproteobacteria bacterium]
MEAKFWLERWLNRQIGWHQDQFNPWLIKYWPGFALPAGSSVFVPLCGKSLDMMWLKSAGHRVFGVELSELAVEEFFAEAQIEFEIVENPPDLPRYRGDVFNIYCGDYLEISARQLNVAHGTYDRGGLVALPLEQRAIYADHVQRVMPDGGHMLLLTFEYDQGQVPGPPFSVEQSEVQTLYGSRCKVELLEVGTTDVVPPHFTEAGVTSAMEGIYHITKEH